MMLVRIGEERVMLVTNLEAISQSEAGLGCFFAHAVLIILFDMFREYNSIKSVVNTVICLRVCLPDIYSAASVSSDRGLLIVSNNS